MPLYPLDGRAHRPTDRACASAPRGTAARRAWHRFLLLSSAAIGAGALFVGGNGVLPIELAQTLYQPRWFALLFALLAAGAVYAVWSSYRRRGNVPPLRAVFAIAGVAGLGSAGLMVNVNAARWNNPTAIVAEFASQVPANARLVSLTAIDHRFAYYYRRTDHRARLAAHAGRFAAERRLLLLHAPMGRHRGGTHRRPRTHVVQNARHAAFCLGRSTRHLHRPPNRYPNRDKRRAGPSHPAAASTSNRRNRAAKRNGPAANYYATEVGRGIGWHRLSADCGMPLNIAWPGRMSVRRSRARQTRFASCACARTDNRPSGVDHSRRAQSADSRYYPTAFSRPRLRRALGRIFFQQLVHRFVDHLHCQLAHATVMAQWARSLHARLAIQ